MYSNSNYSGKYWVVFGSQLSELTQEPGFGLPGTGLSGTGLPGSGLLRENLIWQSGLLNDSLESCIFQLFAFSYWLNPIN